MSGSFDRPGGRRNATQPPHDYDLFDTGMTGPSTGGTAHHTFEAAPRPDARLEAHADMRPPSRSRDTKRRQSSQGPVVPADSVTGRSLTLVITIMCFLACLTAGAVYMINASKNAWLNDIASEVTVQVEPKENVDTEKTVAAVNAYLLDRKGIARATPLALDDVSKLLEPWLGQSDLLASLPVPRLIAIEIDRDAPPDIATLRAELTQKFQGVTLDDHRRWQHQIKTVTNSFALGGLAILLLVAAATTAIIISATRSAMASNREIVEVLHFVGATDRYIAREFEKHFLRLGVRAGLVGALCATGVFLSMRTVMELMGGGDLTVTEIHRLIGTGGLDWAGYLLLGGVVIIIAALCMLTSRFGVFRILNTKP